MSGLQFLIADDFDDIRSGVKQILVEEFPGARIGEAWDTDTLIQKARETNWNLIITDLSMPGSGGIGAMKILQLERTQIPFLFLSIYPQEQYALPLLKAGASGYLHKDAAGEELIKAVHMILSGKKYLSAAQASELSSGEEPQS